MHVLFLVKYFFRFCLRLIRDIDSIFHVGSTFFIKGPNKIHGTCLKRGVCCKNVAVQLNAFVWKYALFRTMIRWWYEFVYNFSYKGYYENDFVLIFECNYLNNSNQCSIYWKRPLICRRYPNVSRFSMTKLMPGCGYYYKKY